LKAKGHDSSLRHSVKHKIQVRQQDTNPPYRGGQLKLRATPSPAFQRMGTHSMLRMAGNNSTP